MQNLLELKGISRRVSDRFSLRDVTLAVEPGQIVGFVGANGAGKTTTIRAALGLIKLDAGEVHLLGQRCDANAPDETQRHLRSRIGLVLDTCPFPSTLKVGQIETLVGPAYPTWDRKTFAGFINRFGLDAKTKVKDLSRGMGMKLQLACALSHNAKLLVLDEATAGLDPMAREELLDELLSFVADGQHSVLLSSHITPTSIAPPIASPASITARLYLTCHARTLPISLASPTAPKRRPPSLWLASKAPVPSTTPIAWTCSCPTVAKRSRPSPRFPAIGQPLTTIYASR